VLPLLLSLLCISGKAVADRPIILDAAADPYASEYVFVTTPVGVYAFNRSSATWTRYNTSTGLPDNHVNVLGLDEGVLWVGTDRGLASADIQVNDWQTWDIGTVLGLAFDPRHVWTATDHGLLRFDKYAERWDTIAAGRVNDVLVDEEVVWLATDSGLRCYSATFNRFEETAAAHDSYDIIISAPSRIWFVGTQRAVSLSRRAGDWSSFPALDLADWSLVGDSLFAVAGDSLALFDPAAGNWRGLAEAPLPGLARGIGVANDTLFVATGQGLVAWSLSGRTRKNYTAATGLTTDTLISCLSDSRYLFAVSAHGIDLLDRSTDIWKFERLAEVAARTARLITLDDAGAHLRLLPGADISLTGRASISDTRSLTNLRAGNPVEVVSLAPVGRHRSGRSLALFYDDSYQRQVEYGASYRGLAGDVLGRASAGRINSEYYEFGLVPGFSLLGAGARLRHAQHAIDLQAGLVRSHRQTDFFSGRSAELVMTRADREYAQRLFYRAPELRGAVDTVFIDDHSAATNGPGTRLNHSFAGVWGDWDVLVAGLDYYVDRDSGEVQFVAPRGADETVIAIADGAPVLLQLDGTNAALVNTYSFGGSITPGSFELTIADTAGRVHPLAEFGLDHDGNGRVDPQLLNCDQGWLRFPGSRPFPDAVYDDTLHLYTLSARYRTATTSYQLSRSPVVKNSEAVEVDGEQLARGTDYIIVYSSGFLTILRRELVTDLSQISVQYSVADESGSELFLAAQPDIAVTDKVHVAPGFTSIDSARIAHLSGKAEIGSGNRNLVFAPQVACGLNRSLAQDLLLTASYGIASLRAEYRGYSGTFPDFGAAQGRYGALRHLASSAVGLEPLRHLRLDGSFSAELTDDSVGGRNTSRYAQARLSYSDQRWPNGYALLGQDALPDRSQRRIKAGVGYELQALGSRLKLDVNGQDTRVRFEQESTAAAFEYIVEAGLSLPVPIQANAWIRSNDLSTRGERSRAEDEVRLRLGVDAVPGLFFTSSYNQQGVGAYADSAQDVSLTGFFQNDLRVAPGAWYSKLSLLNFSLGTSRNYDEYLPGLGTGFRRPALLIAPLDRTDIARAGDLSSLYGEVALNPLSNLLLKYRRSLIRSGQTEYALPELRRTAGDEARVEYQPSGWGSITALYTRRLAELYPTDDQHNIYLEWTKPWSTPLQTRLTAGWNDKAQDYSTGTADRTELRAGFQTLFRFDTRSYATLDIGASRNTSQSSISNLESGISLLPGAGLNLNLFRFLYIQLNYNSTIPLSGIASHSITARFTGQF
jgi:hypothetical protein